jgi:hypothetical protein
MSDADKDTYRRSVKAMAICPGETCEEGHARFLQRKSAEGWRYGKVRDEEKREDPSIVEYEHLPYPKRNNMEIVVTIIRAMWEERNG